jgi:hypothetical protein
MTLDNPCRSVRSRLCLSHPGIDGARAVVMEDTNPTSIAARRASFENENVAALRYLIEVVDAGSFSQAARRLGVNPSTLNGAASAPWANRGRRVDCRASVTWRPARRAFNGCVSASPRSQRHACPGSGGDGCA